MARSRRFQAMQAVERRRMPKPSVQGRIYSESCVKGLLLAPSYKAT